MRTGKAGSVTATVATVNCQARDPSRNERNFGSVAGSGAYFDRATM